MKVKLNEMAAPEKSGQGIRRKRVPIFRRVKNHQTYLKTAGFWVHGYDYSEKSELCYHNEIVVEALIDEKPWRIAEIALMEDMSVLDATLTLSWNYPRKYGNTYSLRARRSLDISHLEDIFNTVCEQLFSLGIIKAYDVDGTVQSIEEFFMKWIKRQGFEKDRF